MQESKWTDGRPLWYLLDAEGKPYPTNDSGAANDLLGDVEKRRVGFAEKQVGDHHIEISTVFLVMDLDYFTGIPILYETMIFIDGSGRDIRYYHTKEEAVQGHEELVAGIEQLGQQNIDTTQIIGLLTGPHDEP